MSKGEVPEASGIYKGTTTILPARSYHENTATNTLIWGGS
jgi:hypothetical protein